MKNKSKKVEVEQLKVVEAENRDCPVRGSKDVSISVPNSIHHTASKEKVSWSISETDMVAIREIITDINDELLDVYAEERRVWKQGGKKGPRPVMTSSRYQASDVYRLAVRLGRIAIQKIMDDGESLPSVR